MNQAELYREVARVTGETVSEIRQIGFSLVKVPIFDDRTLHVSQQRAHLPRKQRQASSPSRVTLAA